MYRRGRAAVQDITAGDELFRRCAESDIDFANGKAFISAFSFPDISVNMGRFGEPGDCRYPHFHHQFVVGFPAGAVLPTVQAENGGRICNFRVIHEPDEDNYGHAVIRAFRAEDQAPIVENKHIPKTVKTKFRQWIADRTRIACGPNPELNPSASDEPVQEP
jgi:hypothetical protein